jgi:hypothetical protein
MNSSDNRPLSEFEIRNALRLHLAATACTTAVVREELPIGRSRIDMARLGASIEGFEIKSDFDSFQRLPTQVDSFSSVFDSLTLVTGSSWAAEAEREVPKCWGLMVASRITTKAGKERVMLREHRPALANPSQSSTALAAMLWKQELLEALQALGTPKPKSSWNADRLRSELVMQAPIEWIKSRVLARVLDPLRDEPLRRAAALRAEARQRRPQSALRVARPPVVYAMLLAD